MVQSFVKIEQPKSFGSMSLEDVDSWIFSMELYFHAENQIPPVQHGLHPVLNLSADEAILFRAQTADLNSLSWDWQKIAL